MDNFAEGNSEADSPEEGSSAVGNSEEGSSGVGGTPEALPYYFQQEELGLRGPFILWTSNTKQLVE